MISLLIKEIQSYPNTLYLWRLVWKLKSAPCKIVEARDDSRGLNYFYIAKHLRLIKQPARYHLVGFLTSPNYLSIRCRAASAARSASAYILKPGCVANALSMTRLPRWRARCFIAEVVRAPAAKNHHRYNAPYIHAPS